MKRPWMFFVVLLFITPAGAHDATDFYRGDGFEPPIEEEGPAPTAAPAVTIRPEPRPEQPNPRITIERADPAIPTRGGQPGKFTNTTARDRKAPIFSKFQVAFEKCRKGCDAGWAHCYGKRHKSSCHTTGDAMDLHGLVCDGKNYSAYTNRFKEFVDCMRDQSYQGTDWVALYRQTGRRNGCNKSSRNHTTCHYNHAHFSLGCWRNGRRKF